MNADSALWKCTVDALDSLGESTTQAITWQMSGKGVMMAPDSFDLKSFAAALDELLGAGSEILLNIICRNLCEHLEADFPIDPRISALEKINRILESKKRN